MPKYSNSSGGGGGGGAVWKEFRITAETEDCVSGAIVQVCLPYAYTITEIACGMAEAPTGSQTRVEISHNSSGLQVVGSARCDANENTSNTSSNYPFAIANASVSAGAVTTFTILAVGSTTPGKGLVVNIKMTIS